jgi:YHS domain-containing protein
MKKIVMLSILPVLFAGLLATGCGKPRTETGQKMCPVMAKEVNPKVFTEYEGRKIYFCCEQCKADFAKDPKKYVAIVDAELKAAAEAAPVSATPVTEPAKPAAAPQPAATAPAKK